MREVVISGVVYDYRDDVVDWLIKRGALCECGDGHDLHLTPDHVFDLIDVETLVMGELSEYAYEPCYQVGPGFPA